MVFVANVVLQTNFAEFPKIVTEGYKIEFLLDFEKICDIITVQIFVRSLFFLTMRCGCVFLSRYTECNFAFITIK